MKFEIDKRTGMMVQKKDEEIYFAGSMGGGLRIDDNKNNVRYIIERTGKITNIMGIRGENVHLYDMRDARIIADRVVRMFGRSHKYSDYHYFLKGYHMNENIKSFDEFINEGISGNIGKRSLGKTQRKEDVNYYIGVLPNMTKLYMDKDNIPEGRLIYFDNNVYYYLEDSNTYLIIFNDNDIDTYYRYNPDTEENYNVTEMFTCTAKLRESNFVSLIALIKSQNLTSEDLDDITDINIKGNVYIESGFGDYSIWDNEDTIRQAAIEYEKEIFDECGWDKKTIEDYRNHYGDDMFDIDALKEVFKEDYDSLYDDYTYGDGEDAIDDLIRFNIIEDTEEYFELDEDGDIDHSQPKFDFEDYREDFVDKMMDGIDDYVDEYVSNFGKEGIEDYIDIDKLAEKMVDEYGYGVLSSYNDKCDEEYIDDTTYYIIREN